MPRNVLTRHHLPSSSPRPSSDPHLIPPTQQGATHQSTRCLWSWAGLILPKRCGVERLHCVALLRHHPLPPTTTLPFSQSHTNRHTRGTQNCFSNPVTFSLTLSCLLLSVGPPLPVDNLPSAAEEDGTFFLRAHTRTYTNTHTHIQLQKASAAGITQWNVENSLLHFLPKGLFCVPSRFQLGFRFPIVRGRKAQETARALSSTLEIQACLAYSLSLACSAFAGCGDVMGLLSRKKIRRKKPPFWRPRKPLPRGRFHPA